MKPTRRISAIARLLPAVACAALTLAACAGEDYTPLYFPPEAPPEAKGPTASEAAAKRQCTLTFTSQLCVTIKGDNIEVGAKDGDELCAEVPPFPIHVDGGKATIRGSEFPDIVAEGHGLPVPITINARGDGDGTANIAEGTIDEAGNMTIERLSLFIVALGIVGEVPNLTLTTGNTAELPHLPPASGRPPDASGAMSLAAATVLGHTIDAADKYLKGASLTAVFTGQVSPPLAQCGEEEARAMEVKGLVISTGGQQSLIPLPDGNRMEVSQGTYIAEGPSDIGARFEAKAKFLAKNIGTRPQQIRMPERIGPFHLKSLDPLTRELKPQQSFILEVKFLPTSLDKPGAITRAIAIGQDRFELYAVALAKSADGSVAAVGDGGTVTEDDIGQVDVGESKVPASASRGFFMCKAIQCPATESSAGESGANDAKAWTDCSDCPSPESTPCELLQLSASGRPLAEVDGSCKPKDPGALPLYAIDLTGPGNAAIAGKSQVLAIRNKGVADMRITAISVMDEDGSKSKGEFSIPEGAIFVAKGFGEIAPKVAAAISGKKPQGASFPITLPPFHAGYDETTAYVVVTYRPQDLAGSDGGQAGVGSAAVDKAIIRIETDAGEITTVVTGRTTVSEAPAIEIHFKTSTGAKRVPDGGSFPFRGVTAQTQDLAVPLFIRVPETAPRAVRIRGISIEGDDAANFKWLGTAEEIAAVAPPAGKGMRCSVPTIEEGTGELTGESFDLKPVAIGASGYDIAPGAHSIATMPLFGCVDFHRDEGAPKKRLFGADLIVKGEELSAQGLPIQNPDGSERQIAMGIHLLASVGPRQGKVVLRITQTMAAIMNPQTPSLSAIPSRADEVAGGNADPKGLQLFTGAFILDPFDEETIRTSDGKEVISTPGDGVTAVFRGVDTHPVSQIYEEERLFDHASMTHDGSRPAGQRGIYEDFPNVPEGAKMNGWRIFTAALSYPGPLAPPERVPRSTDDCAIINPCDPKEVKLFTDDGARGGKGACAFFYASGGRYDSLAYHTADEMEGGEYKRFCEIVDRPQRLADLNTGRYSVDGRIDVEEIGLRFSGPTFLHNAGGPLGPKPALDEIFHLSFTTGVLKPQGRPEDADVLPDPKIDLAKNEFKINLSDKSLAQPPLCAKNTKNRLVAGKRYSTWRYFDGLLFKDEDGKAPAGCPEEGTGFTGGQAYLKGRDLDPETGVVTFVAAAKFGSSEDLSLAFKDVMIFIVLNGWLCDPQGDPQAFEGGRCFDSEFNERDAVGQISIVK